MFVHIKTKKKELFLLVFLFAILVLYAMALILLANFNLFNFWFVVGLLFLSLYMFAKAVVFRSDSSLYLATLCLIISVLGGLSGFIYLKPTILISFIFLSFAICHLVLCLFFNKISNLFTFIFFFLLFLPLILYSFYCINLLTMILFICGDVVTFMALHICDKYE